MKQILTLLLVAMVSSTFAQVDGNGGVTRDDHTNGIEKIDYQANIDAYAVNSQLILTSTLNSPFQEVTIFNVQGRLMTTQVSTSNREVIDINGYTPGIYFVRVKVDDEVVVKKVFVSNN